MTLLSAIAHRSWRSKHCPIKAFAAYFICSALKICKFGGLETKFTTSATKALELGKAKCASIAAWSAHYS